MRPPKVPGSKLGKFLHRQLKDHGIAQSQLAKRLSVSSATITRLLQGETKRLKTVTIEDFCGAIKLSPEHAREFRMLVAETGLSFATGAPGHATASRCANPNPDLPLPPP